MSLKGILIVGILWLPGVLVAARPNLLLILADDMGYSDLGCYGSGIETPHLDRLAAEGLRFSRFHNTGRCCPSRASLLTGLYPHQAGVGHMLGKTEFPSYSDGLRKEVATLPEVLGKAGYHTFMSGKWHLGWADGDDPNSRGFDRFYGSRGYVDSYFTIVPRTDIYLDGRIVNPAGKPPVNHLHPEREFYTTDTYTDYALHFIDGHLEQRAGKPFFGYLAYNAPHFPLHARPEDTRKYRGRFREGGWDPQRKRRFEKLVAAGLIPMDTVLSERDSPDWDSFTAERRDNLDLNFALYSAIIDRLDQNIGRMVGHLEKKGILDNTLIVFLSDNGSTKERHLFGMGPKQTAATYDEWGRKGGWSSSLGQGWANVANTPFRRYKREAHQGGIATPCIVWAGNDVAARPKPGSLTHQVAHIIDVLPTFVELAGAKRPMAPADCEVVPDADSFGPVLGRSLVPVLKGSAIGPRVLFWEHEGNRAVLDGDWKLVALQDQQWELYDLSKDRSETASLADDEAHRGMKMAMQWHGWAKRVGVKPWPEVQASRKRVRARAKK